MKNFFWCLFFIALPLLAMHENVPEGVTIIMPPSNKHNLSTIGIPLETQICLPATLPLDIAPNKDIIDAIQLLNYEKYQQALNLLNTVTQVTVADANNLITLNQALESAFERSESQQTMIWDSATILIGAGSLCCAIDKPSYQAFAQAPEIACALYTAAYYLLCQCCHHAKALNKLEKLEKIIKEKLTPIPPFYHITLPPPTMVMSYHEASSSSAPLERTYKSAYDECRIRESQKNKAKPF